MNDDNRPRSSAGLMAGLLRGEHASQNPSPDLEPVTVAVVRRLDNVAALLVELLEQERAAATHLARIADAADAALEILRAARSEAEARDGR